MSQAPDPIVVCDPYGLAVNEALHGTREIYDVASPLNEFLLVIESLAISCLV